MRMLMLLTCFALATMMGCEKTTAPAPAPSIPPEVDSLTAMTILPLKQDPDVRWAAYPPGVAVFRMKYGNPMDCIAGCFYSVGFGLLNRGKVGWFQFEDVEQRDLSEIGLYSLDNEDEHLYSSRVFEALEDVDSWFFRYSFLHRLAAQTTVRSDVLILVARTLEGFIDNNLARTLIENAAVRTDHEVLYVLAAIPPFNSSYVEIRDEARMLLSELTTIERAQ